MTNGEKYLKDGVDVEELIKELYAIQDCNYNKNMNNCREFFGASIVPTLTEDERVILRNIPKKYKTIRRIGNNVQVDTEDKEEFACICAFNRLFQFIKERRRIFN